MRRVQRHVKSHEHARILQVGTARIDFVYDKRDLIEVKTPIGRVPVHTSTNPLVLQVCTRT